MTTTTAHRSQAKVFTGIVIFAAVLAAFGLYVIYQVYVTPEAVAPGLSAAAPDRFVQRMLGGRVLVTVLLLGLGVLTRDPLILVLVFGSRFVTELGDTVAVLSSGALSNGGTTAAVFLVLAVVEALVIWWLLTRRVLPEWSTRSVDGA